MGAVDVKSSPFVNEIESFITIIIFSSCECVHGLELVALALFKVYFASSMSTDAVTDLYGSIVLFQWNSSKVARK